MAQSELHPPALQGGRLAVDVDVPGRHPESRLKAFTDAASSRSSMISLGILSVTFIGGLAGAGLLNLGLAQSNRTEFCVSCHATRIPWSEYQASSHYRNRTGIEVGCADCHVPRAFLPRLYAKFRAVKDVYHELLGTIDTPEEYEARRWLMANRVWDSMKATDSATCRSCHDFASMDPAAQTRLARGRHASAVQRGQTCIDCHKGIAHQQPYAPHAPVENTK